MTRLIIPALIAVLVSGPAWGAEKSGEYTVIDAPTCGVYLDAYSRSKIAADGFTGPHEMWDATGFINGYLTAFNKWVENGLKDVLGSMSSRDAYRWLASWCRDNPSKHLDEGLRALVKKLGGYYTATPVK